MTEITEPDTHDFGDDWEARARETLAEVDVDTDLGVEIARDAGRVSRGELTEAAFNERYRDRLVEEFGIDARPTLEGGPDRPPRVAEVLSAIDAADGGDDGSEVPDGWRSSDVPESGTGPGDVSRRTMLKSAGVAAGTLSVGTVAHRNPGGVWDDDGPIDGEGGVGVAEASDDEDEGTRMGMVIDTDACRRVARCVQECEQENNTSEGALWQFTFAYEDTETGETGFQPRPCQHCEDPPCRDVCPVRARHKRDDGLVLTDYELCIGCRYCQVACPYGVNYFQWGEPTNEGGGFDHDRYDDNDRMVAGNPPEKGIMGKCTFCVHRQDSGDSSLEGTTACEQACPQDVFHFGDLNDPESKPRQYLREKGAEFEDDVRNDVSTWKFQEGYGTRPNVIYLGNQPGEEAEWSHDPNPYSGVGVRTQGREWSLWGDS